MPRVLSERARRSLFSQETADVWVALLTISHPSISTIRVCTGGADVTSSGQLFSAFPFSITLAGSSEDTIPAARLRIDNVDRRIVEAVRSVAAMDPISVGLALVLAETPNVIEVGWFDFALREVRYDSLAVEGTLRHEDIFSDPWPHEVVSPSRFPGIFT